MRRHSGLDEGASLIELLLVLGLVISLAGLTIPVAAQAVEAGRVRHAAGFMAARFREARQRAAFQARATGLVFDEDARGWSFRVCVDGNGNGLRRSEIDQGTDTCPEGPVRLAEVFSGVSVDVAATLRGPAGEPGSPDPVRFGSTDVASFSPDGDATPGTLFLRSRMGAQYCVRVGGISGRTRVLRYDTGTRMWQST